MRCLFQSKAIVLLKCFLIGGLIVLFEESKAQDTLVLDTLEIYKQSKSIPQSFTKNPITLATYLTQNYKRDDQKVLSIAYWIATNIQYNYQAFKQRLLSEKTSVEILRSKKALSHEYAQLFKDMCGSVGIQAAIVNGYTKGFDFFSKDTLYRAEHSWSIVQINGHWHLIDLTYASGRIECQQQVFAKGMVKLFNGRIIPRFKYVQKFNPAWLFVAPDEFIFTHFPNLKRYQLLKQPLAFEAYQAGGWAIHSHLSWFPKTYQSNPAIDAFIQQSKIEQWLLEAQEAHAINSSNHQVKGYLYYLALDSLFRATYDPQTSALIASKRYLQRMADYANIAEIALRQSVEDNNQEYKNKMAQSWAWKKRLFDSNRGHIQQLQKRSQKNTEQEALIVKIENDNLNSQQLVEKHLRHKKRQRVRFNNMDKANSEIAIQNSIIHAPRNVLLHQTLDSLEEVANALMVQKDSLLQFLDEKIQEIIYPKEQLVMHIHRGNLKALRQIVDQKKLALSLVYEDAQVLDKGWFKKSLSRADSINKVIIDTFLLNLYQKQLASQKRMQLYCKLIDNQLELLQKERSHKTQRANTLQYSIGVFVNLENKLLQYKEQLKNCLGFQQRLIRWLENEIQYMHQTIQVFWSDNRLEHYRHVKYMEYRQHIRQAENAKIHLILQKITKIKRMIIAAQS